jgi:CRISP-associated protein Cas1
VTELLNTLYVTTAGTSLHLDGDALRVVHPERQGRHLIPLVRIDHIVAWNGVDLSDDLLHRCAADGRSVTWVTRNGRFLGRVSGPANRQPATPTRSVPCLRAPGASDRSRAGDRRREAA